MTMQERKIAPKRYYNKFIFFLIEMSYWASYYEKWKSEKQISLIVGVTWVMVMIFCNILTILEIIQLLGIYPIVDNILQSLMTESFSLKENKWTIVYVLLPLWLVLEYFIINWIYSRANKKELFGYFENMSSLRKSRGKITFVIYSICSIIIVLYVGGANLDKQEVLQENNSKTIRIEKIEQIRRSMEQRDSLSIKRL